MRHDMNLRLGIKRRFSNLRKFFLQPVFLETYLFGKDHHGRFGRIASYAPQAIFFVIENIGIGTESGNSAGKNNFWVRKRINYLAKELNVALGFITRAVDLENFAVNVN